MQDLELQDTVQSAAESKEKTPRWRGPPKRALSPSSQAVQRANARMPPMWNKFSKPPGFSGRDLRAASTLLVLNHHAQLLVLAAGGFRALVGGAHRVFGGNEEVMVDSDSDRFPSMMLRAGSRVVGCRELNVGEEEKEVELLFEQL
jgi:hypothetical protein